MVNELRESDNLISVDYSDLLQQILQKLPEQNIFKISSNNQIEANQLDLSYPFNKVYRTYATALIVVAIS
ncbi:MAG: hypothetical protein MGG11_11635 [Trichodesmium sp. MAG_R03]|nr:hypothetical protein [Trichodesmium sp. MAG_R03]